MMRLPRDRLFPSIDGPEARPGAVLTRRAHFDPSRRNTNAPKAMSRGCGPSILCSHHIPRARASARKGGACQFQSNHCAVIRDGGDPSPRTSDVYDLARQSARAPFVALSATSTYAETRSGQSWFFGWGRNVCMNGKFAHRSSRMVGPKIATLRTPPSYQG